MRKHATAARSTVSAARAESVRQALLRVRQLAGQELAFGPVQLQREGELVPALPAILRQERRAGGEIGQRRGVGGRRLGALARDQVELGQLLALLSAR